MLLGTKKCVEWEMSRNSNFRGNLELNGFADGIIKTCLVRTLLVCENFFSAGQELTLY